MFEAPAALLAWFYSLTGSYIAAISLIAVVVMLIVTPLTLKSTKGMLEMQRLAPEIRRIQSENRGDRQRTNEEMMRLYQEHKVNPMASCLPLLAQTPVFLIMFRIMLGLTYTPVGGNAEVVTAVLRAGGAPDPETIGFLPRYIGHESVMFTDLVRQTEMMSLGLDLSVSPAQALSTNFLQGVLYALIVVVLGGLYFFQQRMVAARATLSPTMSPAQQKLMQYLPVFFAIFQIFFLLGLVVYYIVQAILRILQQGYITKRFYGSEESLGRQAQRAGERARELAKESGEEGGFFAQARRDLLGDRETPAKGAPEKGGPAKGGAAKGGTAKGGTAKGGTAKGGTAKGGTAKGGTAGRSGSGRTTPSKKTTPPKGRPTPTRRSVPGRPGTDRGRPSS